MTIDWINHRYATQIAEDDLMSIKDFSLFWNIFEATVCDTYYTHSKVSLKLADLNLNVTEFQNNLAYFQNRYVENSDLNNRYSFLHFRDNDNEEIVRKVLLGNTTTSNEKILAIVIIVYRFRCNLFHGNKDIREINYQRENFEQANDFLMKLLNHFY